MKSLRKIEEEVMAWSFANFGVQQSKVTKVPLMSLAPLLGIGEEIGELIKAMEAGDDAEMLDAIGDIGIYLCDFCGRDGFWIERPIMDISRTFVVGPQRVKASMMLMQAYGTLCHAVLKRHQGIRGFDVPAQYEAVRRAAINGIIDGMNEFICTLSEQKQALIITLNDVWDKLVARRDWRGANAKDGGAAAVQQAVKQGAENGRRGEQGAQRTDLSRETIPPPATSKKDKAKPKKGKNKVRR